MGRFNWIQGIIRGVCGHQGYQNQYDLTTCVRKVQEHKLSYLGEAALSDLFRVVQDIEKKKVPGILIETGCALGGSGIVIASAKHRSRVFFIYDVFGMIPPPSDKDGKDIHSRYQVIVEGKSEGINGDAYYGYEPNLLEKVSLTFEMFRLKPVTNNIHLIQGLYEDTLHITSPVAFAHIDCDWYDSVMTCLQRIEPWLSSGGIMIIDDYYAWSGCKRAVDEYFANRQDQYSFVHKSRLHIIKR